MPRAVKTLAALLLCWAVLPAAASRAADKITAGAVGAVGATLWYFHIAQAEGFFADQGLQVELVNVQTAPGVVQQLAGGSLDMVAGVGLTEPIHAVDKGAAMSILRFIGQSAPYAVLAKPGITSIKGLKGKTVSIGGLADITWVIFERMLQANGLAKGDLDLVVSGSTAARFAGLQSGAVDAAILAPPFNFHAEEAGFANAGLASDYITDLPYSGVVVMTDWAKAHADIVRRYLAATNRSIAWFYDDANRPQAVAVLAKVAHSTAKDAEASYDFMRKIKFFEPTGKVSLKQLQNLIDVEKRLGDVEQPLTADRLILPGLTQVAD